MKIWVQALFVLLFGCEATGRVDACRAPQLSEERILQVVYADLERREIRPPKESTDQRITEDGCEYLVLLAAKPARPGDSMVIRIDRLGNVIRISPGR